jgi:16S rRNA (cytidine1402-2'-O)-methyltransferase
LQALNNNPGTLYVVATPIGNLDDISQRARDVLSAVDVVAAEDTRRARQLLTRLGFSRRLLSMHENNEVERVEQLDAGTPLISDPGYRLLAAARERNLPVSPVPGCCAAIAALSICGLPSDRFLFEGFLPARAPARRKRLAALRECRDTVILYESVHRIAAVLDDIRELFGADRPVALARELTKKHETIYRGSIDEVREQLRADPGGGKGEFTLVISGNRESSVAKHDEIRRIVEILLGELPALQAAKLTAKITGVTRREAYKLANELKRN